MTFHYYLHVHRRVSRYWLLAISRTISQLTDYDSYAIAVLVCSQTNNINAIELIARRTLFPLESLTSDDFGSRTWKKTEVTFSRIAASANIRFIHLRFHIKAVTTNK